MGFRMRKSIEVAPGIRLNVSRRGAARRGAARRRCLGRSTAAIPPHSSGRRTVSAGTGISGVYYLKSVGGYRS